jgi:hypothetical protein
MEAVAIVVGVLLVAQIGLNVFITRRVLASDYYEPFQKGSQIAIVWLLPVVGLILVWSIFQQVGLTKIEQSEEEDGDVEESIFADHGTAALPSDDVSAADASASD